MIDQLFEKKRGIFYIHSLLRYRTSKWTENIGIFLYSNSELYDLIDTYVTYGMSILQGLNEEMLGGLLVVELEKRYEPVCRNDSK